MIRSGARRCKASFLPTLLAGARAWAFALLIYGAALLPQTASAQTCLFGFKPPELFVSSDGIVVEADYFFTFGKGTISCPETVTVDASESWVLVTPSDTGEFVGNETFEFGLVIAVAPNTFTESRQAQVRLKAVPGGQVVATLNINQDPVGSVLYLSKEHLFLQIPPGGFKFTEPILVVNKGTQSLVIAARARSTVSIGGQNIEGVPYIGVEPANFLIGPGGARPLEITAPSLELEIDGAGVFTSAIDITATTGSMLQSFDAPPHPQQDVEPKTVTVVMAISDNEGRLSLSRNGLSFVGFSGGAPPPALQVQAHNESSFPLDLAVDVETLSGGDWLQVAPASNALPAATRQLLDFTADPSGLNPGAYYALVTVSGAAQGEHVVGSPQVVTVAFQVAAPGSGAGPLVNPTGLIFVAGEAASQAVQITNLATTPLAVEATVNNPEAGNIFTATSQFSVPGVDTRDLTVSANAANLPAGIYRGSLDLAINGGSSRSTVGLELIVPPGAGGAALTPVVAQGGCAANELGPLFTTIGNGSTLPAGWPIPIDVTVFNNCGFPEDSAAVVVDFQGVSSPPVTLTSLGGGVYTGVWNAPQAAEGGAARLTVTASTTGAGGTFGHGVTLAPSPDAAPRLFPGGVVHSATFVRDPLAPGTIVSVFGENLSSEPATGPGALAPALPLPQELAGTQMWLGGVSIPLLFSREDQVNAILPIELEQRANESLPLVVRRGTSLSFPGSVVLSAAQPGVYTQDVSGSGPGSILDLAFQLNTPQNPAAAGEIVQIYCTGLGEVAPPVPAGQAAPTDVLSWTTAQVTATIGEQPAEVQFAGLAPGYAGLYQVNVYIPNGLPPGPANLVITTNGQPSPPVTVFVGTE